MKCPVCKDVELVMSERQGIEIDYCRTCRGIWLDRGELDKIIEKSLNENDHPHTETMSPVPVDPHFSNHRNHGRHYDHDHYKYRKRKSWLSEIFD